MKNNYPAEPGTYWYSRNGNNEDAEIAQVYTNPDGNSWIIISVNAEKPVDKCQGVWTKIDSPSEIIRKQKALNSVLNSAVMAIYLDDNSDYLPALWSIVNTISPQLADLLEDDPKSAYNVVEGVEEYICESCGETRDYSGNCECGGCLIEL